MSMDNPTPMNDIDWRRQVEKRLARVERRGGGVVNATITGDGDVANAPGIPADNVATGPPEIKPVLSVTGFDDSFVVQAGETFEQTTVLDYYCDGLLVASTTATLSYFTKDGAGNSFEPERPYVWQVVARNDFGTLESDPVVGLLREGIDSSLVLGWVAAGFILTGKIQVGELTIEAPTEDNPGGITIPLLNGGLIHFPADGSDAVITAILRARSLIVENFLEVFGDDNLLHGTLRAVGTTVPGPGSAPSVVTYWDDPTDYDDSGDFQMAGVPYLSGFFDNTTEWLYARTGTTIGDISAVDKTTGAYTKVKQFTDRRPYGGVTKLGGNYYVLTLYNPTNEWQVLKYNSSWVYQSLWTVPTIAVIYEAGITNVKNPCIGNDGTNLVIAQMFDDTGGAYGTHALAFRRFTTAGAELTSYGFSNLSATKHLRSLIQTSADFGAGRFVLAADDQVLVFGSSFGGIGVATRFTTQEWSRAKSEAMVGVTWDGTNFHSLAVGSGRVYKYTAQVAPATRSIAWTKYNSTLGWETTASPASAFTQPARSPLRVDTDPIPAPVGADDPDSARIYIADHRQPDLGVGVTEAIYRIPGTGGAAAPTTGTFPNTTPPGSYEAQVTDALGPLFALPGSGDGVTGPLAWTSNRGPTETLTGTDVITIGSGWSLVSATVDKFGCWCQGMVVYQRTGSTITVTDGTADLTNTTVGTLAAGLHPRIDLDGQSGGSGRNATHTVSPTGVVSLAAIAGPDDIASGTTLSIGIRWYAVPA